MTEQSNGATEVTGLDGALAPTAWLEQIGMDIRSAQGLDVSNFQGMFNWGATAGLSFGIFRLTQGLGGAGTNSPDPTAAHNHAGIAAKGLIRGQYHFLDPRLSGAAQARYFVDQAGHLGLRPGDMLWLDNEADNGVGAVRTAACAREFMAELRTLVPHQPNGCYTYINFAATGHAAGLGGYPLWLAFPSSHAPVPPPPWARWAFWQWGIRNGVDRDAFNGTAGDLRTWVDSFAAKHPAGDHHQHGGRPVVRIVTDGTGTLGQLLDRRHMAPSTLLRLSAERAAAGQFPHTTADWINHALIRPEVLDEVLPSGLVLHVYPRTS